MSPSRFDPSRTATLRRVLSSEVGKGFALLKGAILKLLVGDDSFGLSEHKHDPFAVMNAFCPTGKGGGVDPSCGKGSHPQTSVDYGPHETLATTLAIDAIYKRLNLIGGMTETLPSLVGALPGSKVIVKKSGNNSLFVDVRHKDYHAEREVTVLSDGSKYISNEYLRVHVQGTGLGSAIFAGQVNAASHHGFSHIETMALGDPNKKDNAANGYYTWPLLGYDAEVPKHAQEKFPHAESILDVMSSKQGREWWKANGKTLHGAKFDLTPGSRSMQVMQVYLEERAKRSTSTPTSNSIWNELGNDWRSDGSGTNNVLGEKHDFASTHFEIECPVMLEAFSALQSTIDPADVVKLENDPHITVRYGLHDTSELFEKVSDLAMATGSVLAKVKGLSLFYLEAKAQDVLKWDIDSPQLYSLNRELGLLPNTQTYEYHPHLTVAYLKAGTGIKYCKEPWMMNGHELWFNNLVISSSDETKEIVTINCGGKGGKPGPCPTHQHIQPGQRPPPHNKDATGELTQVTAEFEAKHKGAKELGETGHGLVRKYFGTTGSWDANKLLRLGVEGASSQRIKDHQDYLERTTSTIQRDKSGAKRKELIASKLEEFKRQLSKEYEKPLKAIAQVRQAFASTPIRMAGEKVYRRVGPGVTKGIKVGDTMTDKGFMSTTLSQSHGRAGGKNPEVSGSTLVITSAHGHPAIYYKKEGELLFPEGTSIKVHHIEEHDGERFIHVEMLPHTPTKNSVVANEEVDSGVVTINCGGVGGKPGPCPTAGEYQKRVASGQSAFPHTSAPYNKNDLGISRSQKLALPETEVHFSELYTVQKTVNPVKVDYFVKGGTAPAVGEPMAPGSKFLHVGPYAVRTHDGKLHLEDGNTRLSALAVRGKTSAKIRVVQLDQHGKWVGHPTSNLTTNVSITTNEPWRFEPDPEKIKLFQVWLRKQLTQYIIGKTEEELWRRYTEEGFKKGAGRAFDDTRPEDIAKSLESQQQLGWYKGTKEEFLRSSFGRPVAIEKVQLLASRSFDEIKGLSEKMVTKLTRTLTDGLVQGKGAREIGRDLVDDVGVGKQQAEVIARTEIIRAHAEGQLVAFKQLGVEELGVAVEWATADDERVCPLCRPMEGAIFKVDEAAGMIPRHPNCRCAWIPAGVGEKTAGQQRTQAKIVKAVKLSKKRGSKKDKWKPARPISKSRPQPIITSSKR